MIGPDQSTDESGDRMQQPGTLSTESIETRLERMESLLLALVERETIKDYYEVEEFARLVGKAAFTCREWARLGRIHAEKQQSKRGAHAPWVISHQELQRYRKDGLLPQVKKA